MKRSSEKSFQEILKDRYITYKFEDGKLTLTGKHAFFRSQVKYKHPCVLSGSCRYYFVKKEECPGYIFIDTITIGTHNTFHDLESELYTPVGNLSEHSYVKKTARGFTITSISIQITDPSEAIHPYLCHHNVQFENVVVFMVDQKDYTCRLFRKIWDKKLQMKTMYGSKAEYFERIDVPENHKYIRPTGNIILKDLFRPILTEFLESLSIPWMPIPLKVENGTKRLEKYKDTGELPDIRWLTQSKYRDTLRKHKRCKSENIAFATNKIAIVNIKSPNPKWLSYPHYKSIGGGLHIFTAVSGIAGMKRILKNSSNELLKGCMVFFTFAIGGLQCRQSNAIADGGYVRSSTRCFIPNRAY